MKTILVAVDFSESKVLQQAIALGRAPDTELLVVHVTSDALRAAYASTQFYDVASEYMVAPSGDVELARELCAEEYKREHQALLQISAQMRDEGIRARALLLKGDAAERIVETARERAVDFIVIGSHGHGLLRKMLVGSVTEAVLRDAPCSVLVVPVRAQKSAADSSVRN